MTPSQCRTQIQNLCDTLLAAGVAVDCIRSTLQQSQGRGSRVSWPPPPDPEVDHWFLADFFSIETFFGWLSARQYSAVLLDGSLLQLTFDFRGRELSGHRLAYIPCPFDIGKDGTDLLRSEPILDVIELYRARGEEFLRLRTPIRFDYDPAAANAQHPAAHVTLNEHDCRIPTCAPLSLEQFIDFVFRRFYPKVWMAQGFLREAQWKTLPRQILELHERSMHLNWQGGGSRG